MPEICRFFGIIIRMFFDEHDPPHFHAEYQGNKAVFDFTGNIMKGSLHSKTATRLVREWIDLRLNKLEEDWELARAGKEIKKIAPLE
ncbi:MAG: transcriptional regulator [Deltaproteobacteria bacterium RBG_16_49_23]|nr:MAG: transcriptional regulator [Deltaproteobacteria bacterium RBG_16_49_23]